MNVFALLAIITTAQAFDTTSNNTCATPEVIEATQVGRGSLSSSSDTDAFHLVNLSNGTLQLVLLNRGNFGTDKELAFTDGAGGTSTATINNCEEPVSVAMDSVDSSGLGWVACTDKFYVVGVDLSSIASSYTASTILYTKASSGAFNTHYPVFVDVAQNGAFVIFGSYRTTGAANASYVYSVSRSDATTGGSVYNGSYDAVSEGFTKPRGVAITPMLSIATPRPGTTVGGIKRVHVIVRDPGVSEIIYLVDGTEVDRDSKLADGSSEDCLLDTSAWSSGSHELSVVAIGGPSGDYQMGATYYTY